MPTRYSVCVLGCGPRGDDHLHGFRENSDRFEVLAICDQNPERLQAAADKYGIQNLYGDADKMLATHKPDVFCFATMPDLRWPLVELGLRHNVKAIALEKPIALSVSEARLIRDACDAAGVKWIASHQQKYGEHFQSVKNIADAGDIGKVHTIHATARAWLMQLGTHMIDYCLWLNGESPFEWVVGQTHGTEHYEDSHPSPDHVSGILVAKNGVRVILECGYLSKQWLSDDHFWVDDSITLYGTHGWARIIVGGGWQALTKNSGGKIIEGPGFFNPILDQPPYIAELADWLDNTSKPHPCRGELACHGFEAAMGLCLSSLERRQVTIPLETIPDPPIFEQLQKIQEARP